MANTQTNDFSKGSVAENILRLALPMTVAQLINVLYSVVDRMYIGRLPDAAGNALTGLGLTFPILLLGLAALMLLTVLSGSSAIAVSLLAVGAAIALGAAAGTAIRRRRKK